MKVFASIDVPDGVASNVIERLRRRGFEVFQAASRGASAAVSVSAPSEGRKPLLAHVVEELRVRHRLTLEDIAAFAGVTHQTIRNWMRTKPTQPKKVKVLRDVLAACQCAPGAAAQVREVAKAKRRKAKTGKRFRIAPKLADREKAMIRSLRGDGLSIPSVAILTGVSQAGVRQVIREKELI